MDLFHDAEGLAHYLEQGVGGDELFGEFTCCVFLGLERRVTSRDI